MEVDVEEPWLPAYYELADLAALMRLEYYKARRHLSSVTKKLDGCGLVVYVEDLRRGMPELYAWVYREELRLKQLRDRENL